MRTIIIDGDVVVYKVAEGVAESFDVVTEEDDEYIYRNIGWARKQDAIDYFEDMIDKICKACKNYQLRYLHDGEEEQLNQAANELWKGILLIALNTGLRQSNVRLLQGRNIKLDFKIIEITENKGNKHIKIPMNDKVYDFFKDKKFKDDEYIFINPKTKAPFDRQTFQKAWLKLKGRAKIETPLRFHDLRHTVGTRLIEQGVPITAIRELLAHSDIKTTTTIHSLLVSY